MNEHERIPRRFWRRLALVTREAYHRGRTVIVTWVAANPNTIRAARAGRMIAVLRSAPSTVRRARALVPSPELSWPVRVSARLVPPVPDSLRTGVSLLVIPESHPPELRIRHSGDRLDVSAPSREGLILDPIDVRLWRPTGFGTSGRRAPRSFNEAMRIHASGSPADVVARLRRSRCVLVPEEQPVMSEHVRPVVELAAGGVLVSGPVSDGAARLLGPNLTRLVSAPLESDSRQEREHRAVRLTRAAHHEFSPHGRWMAIGEHLGITVDAQPRVSVLLASKRPADVVDAAHQIAQQKAVCVELVVGLHGPGMPASLDAELRDVFDGDLVILHPDDSMSLGSVMNELTSAASAPLVSKWDDDDWYDAWHLLDLVLALEHSGAGLVGKAAEFVYLEGRGITIRRLAGRSEHPSTTLAGGTLLARADDVREVGWTDAPRRVDRLLIEGFLEHGLSTYRTHGFGYVLRRRAGAGDAHTWGADEQYFLKQASEKREGLDLSFAGFNEEFA